MYYPVFLDLRGKRVLVVGAGSVALRKVRGLLEAGALVTVVSPERRVEFEDLGVSYFAKAFGVSDMDGGYALVFSATNDREVNRLVGELARERGIPANIADAPLECGFIVPARLTRGDVQVAVSTGGRDPRVAAEVRDRIAVVLGEYSVLERGVDMSVDAAG